MAENVINELLLVDLSSADKIPVKEAMFIKLCSLIYSVYHFSTQYFTNMEVSLSTWQHVSWLDLDKISIPNYVTAKLALIYENLLIESICIQQFENLSLLIKVAPDTQSKSHYWYVEENIMDSFFNSTLKKIVKFKLTRYLIVTTRKRKDI